MSHSHFISSPSPAPDTWAKHPLNPLAWPWVLWGWGPMALLGDFTKDGSRTLHRYGRKTRSKASSSLFQLTPRRCQIPCHFQRSQQQFLVAAVCECCWQVLPSSRPPRCFLTSAWSCHVISASQLSPLLLTTELCSQEPQLS